MWHLCLTCGDTIGEDLDFDGCPLPHPYYLVCYQVVIEGCERGKTEAKAL